MRQKLQKSADAGEEIKDNNSGDFGGGSDKQLHPSRATRTTATVMMDVVSENESMEEDDQLEKTMVQDLLIQSY